MIPRIRILLILCRISYLKLYGTLMDTYVYVFRKNIIFYRADYAYDSAADDIRFVGEPYNILYHFIPNT